MSKSFLLVMVLMFGMVIMTVISLVTPLQRCSNSTMNTSLLSYPDNNTKETENRKNAEQACNMARKKGNMAEKLLRQFS